MMDHAIVAQRRIDRATAVILLSIVAGLDLLAWLHLTGAGA